jgi:hypothetical protein
MRHEGPPGSPGLWGVPTPAVLTSKVPCSRTKVLLRPQLYLHPHALGRRIHADMLDGEFAQCSRFKEQMILHAGQVFQTLRAIDADQRAAFALPRYGCSVDHHKSVKLFPGRVRF